MNHYVIQFDTTTGRRNIRINNPNFDVPSAQLMEGVSQMLLNDVLDPATGTGALDGFRFMDAVRRTRVL